MKNDTISLAVVILLIIGGLNWGLVGLLDLDVVALIAGKGTLLTKLVYDVIGLAALYKIYAKWIAK